jgi:adenylosuccinate synthase
MNVKGKADILLGLQWGDEGKGKIVDVMAPQYDIIARFQGGPNAGHTLEFNGTKHVLHTIPSGIFHPTVENLVGNGVVIDPVVFIRELDQLITQDSQVAKRLFISRKAHMITPTHCMLDRASEASKGDAKIGSTLKGIGPAYMDKTGRNGLRIGDILSDDFQRRYDALRSKHILMLENLYGHQGFNQDELIEREKDFFKAIESMKHLQIIDGEGFIQKALAEGKKVLAEGAQGSLLDVDFGTYPFVTSSNTVAAGACTGLGLAPRQIGEVFGIFKAYCTRVGSGPFPTELNNEVGEKLRQTGREFGSTTGRPRRCGWLDMPALKYACAINGVSQLIMMKSDVMSELDEILYAHQYRLGESVLTDFPYQLDDSKLTVDYEKMPGWKSDIREKKNWNDLPGELQNYVAMIEKNTGAPISVISVGPDREETIYRSIDA